MKRILSLFVFLLLLVTLCLSPQADTDLRTQLFSLLSENYAPEEYSVSSYAVYHAALTEALQKYDSPTATEEELSEAVGKLSNAIRELVPIASPKVLLDYAEELDQYIHDVRMHYAEGLREQMIAARDEFLVLAESKDLSEGAFLGAKEKYESLMTDAGMSAYEKGGFSLYNENEGIVIPENYMEDEESAGKVTFMRINLVYLAAICIPVGLIVFIVYLATGRKKKKA